MGRTLPSPEGRLVELALTIDRQAWAVTVLRIYRTRS